MGFIEKIIEGIATKDLPGIRDHAYVFPTRRAGLYFKDKLGERFHDQPVITPSILSIQEFIEALAGQQVTEPVRLLFELFDVYKSFEPGLAFDRFYAWGKILLDDYDEIDRNLADASEVYSNLAQIQDIQEKFGGDDESEAAIREFSKLISTSGQSDLVRKFKLNWEWAGKAYEKFTSCLEEKNLAYEGMLYRKVAGRLDASTDTFPFFKVFFCGFNAITGAEEKIIDNLYNNNKAALFWDADQLYLDNDNDEAGHFLRKYRRKWKGGDVHWIIHNMREDKKNISIIGGAKSTAQSKIAGEILSRNNFKPERTAIILADENLLLPVLYTLPEDIGQVNVTMGYPLKFSAFYALLRNYFELIISASKHEEPYLRGNAVIDLLSNPVIQAISPEARFMVADIIDNRKNWIKRSVLISEIKEDVLRDILSYPSKTTDILDHLRQVLVKLFYALRSKEEFSKVHLEFDYHFLRHLQILKSNIQEHLSKLDPEMLFRIIRESLISTNVPFVGEPIRGLQVMGFLESRLLDFDHLIILSVNEGKLPKAHAKYTYIPYAVRKAFNLPTFEHADRIYAYHFKRLIQRVRDLFIIYDTEVAIDGSGERSRLILQLKQDLKNSPSGITDKLYTTELNITKAEHKITIPKTSEVMAGLDRFKADGSDSTRYLGPTLLADYIDCSLRFYFRHVARIPEQEVLTEEMDAREFGIVVHDAFEALYRPDEGKWLDQDALKKLLHKEHIEKIVDEALVKNGFLKKEHPLEGKNILNRSVIIRLLEEVIRQDIRDAPVRITALESADNSFEFDAGNNTKVLLGGKIDRLDEVKSRDTSVARIIDYKTGKAGMVSSRKAAMKDYREYMDQYFSDSRFKAGFQAYYYTMIHHRNNPDVKIKSGIYGLQEVSNGIQFLRKGKIIDPGLIREFEERLSSVIRELYDPAVPFVETDDHTRCEYCPYRTICRTA